MTHEFASPISFKLIAFLCYGLTHIDIAEMRYKSRVITSNPIVVNSMDDFAKGMETIRIHNNLVKMMQLQESNKHALTMEDVFDYFYDLSILRKSSKEVFASSQTISLLKVKADSSDVPFPELYKIAFGDINNATGALGWTIQNSIMMNELAKSTDYFIVKCSDA